MPRASQLPASTISLTKSFGSNLPKSTKQLEMQTQRLVYLTYLITILIARKQR
jgi:hypothetical protein